MEIGPFTTRLQTHIPNVRENIGLLYASYSIKKNDAFVDFDVRIASPKSLRRWLHPQVLFFFDGRSHFKPLPKNQAYALFEWGLNWCVAQHANQYLILHAAVIERDGYAVIMAAPPETGKSTLCAGLIGNGWRLLSDELALISPENGLLTPIPRPVSLKNKSIDLIRNFLPEATIAYEAVDTTKGVIAHMKVPDESIARSEDIATPAWIVCPRYETGARPKLERRSKARTFMHIVQNAFNYDVHREIGFQTVASLIERCDCYEFTYSCLDEAVSTLDDLEPPSEQGK
jgi:HprK-related kinase A